MRRFASIGALFGAALLAVATGLGGCMQTSTYGTGERPGFAIFREMSGGIGEPRQEPIRYQPRAPLVMPPAAGQLPPPLATADAADAAWPRDYDSVAEGSRFGDDNPVDDISPEEARRLRPLAGVFGNRGSGQTRIQKEMEENRPPAYDIIGDRAQRETFRAALDEKDGVGRTERRYLTEPPQIYREPAATAPTEFEEIEKKRGFFLTRWITGG